MQDTRISNPSFIILELRVLKLEKSQFVVDTVSKPSCNDRSISTIVKSNFSIFHPPCFPMIIYSFKESLAKVQQ